MAAGTASTTTASRVVTLHRRIDEEFDVDPDDDAESFEYIVDAEEAQCGGLCRRCGLKHDEPESRCPHCNVTHLRATA